MTIRLARPEDAPEIRAIYAPLVEETAVSFEEEPPSEAAMADRIADTLREFPWLVCERDAPDGDPEIAGYAYGGPYGKRGAYRWSVDASIYVAEDHRRAGVAAGLYESLFAVLRSQGFYNVYAGIALPNPASVALHESLGFERVGIYDSIGYKCGSWWDVGWWQLQLQDRPDDPAKPRPLPELDGTPAFEAALSAGESSVDA